MKTISKFTISLVSVAIICLLINGNTKVVAVGNIWVSKGDALNRMGSSASTTNSGHNFSSTLRISGPNKFAPLAIVISPLGLQAASPVGVGGAQSSCSSSSIFGVGGITINTNSVSKPGQCP
jgi:hypothetical protein